MAKKSTIFFCQNCGYESAKWLGQCPACKEWNTLVEETVVTGKAGKSSKKTESLAARIHEAQPVKLSGIKTESEIRTATGFEELDRVLGGGIVAGSLVLVGGDPGIGKSTILLQVCKNLTEKGKKVLYISGEESLQQIKLRASRIGSFGEEMLLLCETSLETIQGVIERVQPGNRSDRFDPDDVSGRRFLRTGKCIAGKRSYFCIYADRKTYGNLHFYCRTCDKRRSCRRTESSGAYG